MIVAYCRRTGFPVEATIVTENNGACCAATVLKRNIEHVESVRNMSVPSTIPLSISDLLDMFFHEGYLRPNLFMPSHKAGSRGQVEPSPTVLSALSRRAPVTSVGTKI
jgi:hypothetical protein